MRGEKKRYSRGFSLIELLIVMALMGIVALAIISLYRTTNRTAATSDEVIEVQQNLRIALDQISRDLRMAGFMITPLSDAFQQADATSLTLVTATATGRAARIAEGPVIGTATTSADFIVALEEMVDQFSTGDQVRVLRPTSHGEPIAAVFTIGQTDRDNRRIRLNDFSGVAVPVNYISGDLIVQATAPSNTIGYCLGPSASCGPAVAECPDNQTCLMRVVNGTASVLAGNIAPEGLTFTYFLENGGPTSVPEDLGQIRGVRVELTGETVSTVPLSGGQPKTRTIASVVKLRNR
jgi:prepilin-type N-terminal cleavage/methylation domain-containing protein